MPKFTHHIGYAEGLALLTVYLSAKIFTSCPSQMIYLESTSAWITVLLAAIPAATGMTANYRFVSRFHGLHFQQCVELTIGKVLGKTMGVAFLVFMLAMNAIPLREFAGGIKTAILPETPLGAIALVTTLIPTWAAGFGLEPIARFASVVSIPLSILLFLVLAGVVRVEVSISEIFPFWGAGFARTITGGIPCSSIYAEGFAVGLLTPYLREETAGQGRRLVLVSLLLSAIAISGATFMLTVIFTAPVAAQTLYPGLQIARLVIFGLFVERLEALFVFAGIAFVAIRMAFGVLISAFLLADVLGVKRWNVMVWLVAAVTYFLALRPDTLVDVFLLQITLFRSIGWIMAFLVPVILAAIARVRNLNWIAPRGAQE